MLEIDQALLDAFINAAFGLPIAHENLHYDPDPKQEYAELLVLPNDLTAYSYVDSDETDGVFRVILRYPVDTGAVDAKMKADEIFNVFKIGSRFTYGGTTLTIVSNHRQPGADEKGWYKLVLSMRYVSFLRRV